MHLKSNARCSVDVIRDVAVRDLLLKNLSPNLVDVV